MLTAETEFPMITRAAPRSQQAGWRRSLAMAVTDPAELLTLLDLDPGLLDGARLAARAFRLRVPRGFVARMQPRDPADPLLRQVLPLAAELEEAPGFGSDPVGDGPARAAPGLLSSSRCTT